METLTCISTYQITSRYKRLLADVITPVGIYLRIRDHFASSILLENSDYHGQNQGYSYICFDPIAGIEYKGGVLTTTLPDQDQPVSRYVTPKQFLNALGDFKTSFSADSDPFPFITNGLFGYLGYSAVECFEDIVLEARCPENEDMPAAVFQAYRYLVAFNHQKNELYLFEHRYSTPDFDAGESRLETIVNLITNRDHGVYSFRTMGPEESNFTDEEFRSVIEKGKTHCQQGDVFQIVLSRRYYTPFAGDEFNVYRALRSLNPSPYLFYFDYGDYRLFGSSPESQLVIDKNQATIYPIAGTFRRTGDVNQDAILADKLYNDPKESAEHVMLVDLARNDLSRSCYPVKVEAFKEVQYYSHVIHLVSKVVGTLGEGTDPLRIVAETFPAGTLSGAPKYRALQLIDQYEKGSRGHYAGSIGYMGFNGEFNQAIMIRTFVSRNNVLHYQAGAGIVSQSVVESELQEVHNKLAALRAAMEQAKTI